MKIREKDLDDLLNNIENYYYEKITEKTNDDGSIKLKNGVPDLRIINPSIHRLKAIQKRLSKVVLSKIQIPSYAYGGIKGKDNIKNANVHKGKKFNFTTDLSAFFPSINNKQVYEMFISFDFSPDVASKLVKLTTYKGKVPQGAPTSSLIANLVFIKTGNKLSQLAIENKLAFTTFVDDITLSGSECFKEKIQSIIQIINNDGYLISHKKTHYKAGNKIVTGVGVGQNGLTQTNSLKNKILKEKDKDSPKYKGLINYKKRIFSFNNPIYACPKPLSPD
ncbi:reverse transcriptase family protein [Mucilaginibacter sp.]|uniref:reverse transcriptase family protein n=1 Tax=Mucilaginibacter sp. TaxID=1882438 RepID=UPI0026366434|nr:reverse transcriptase family protein [Mucilaginibacter sp.]MDB5029708.1 reverse transcriptase [Mucilaginibacter sp.]